MTQVTDFNVMAQDGQAFALEAYRGQVLLIVNTASRPNTKACKPSTTATATKASPS